ncbi:MAG TPA: DUF4129 domain-containing protein [Trebonia sp.]
MTARQQIVRLLPLVLLIVLVIAGLRGVVPAPRWDGPLKADGVAIGIAVEVIFGALLLVIRSRDAAARRAVDARPYSAEEQDVEPPQALRFTLKYVIGLCMIAVAITIIANLHLHFLAGSNRTVPPTLHGLPKRTPPAASGGGGSFHIPLGPILYGLLIAVIVAAVVVTIWWSTRLRRPAAPLFIEDVSSEELREAVNEGRAALARIDDAREAIIACYLAMERRLADRGAARGAADTPDELLARAVASGIVRGGAAGRLTTLFYEARFSTHPLVAGQRDAASAALDELADELAERRTSAEESGDGADGRDGESARPGGGWV